MTKGYIWRLWFDVLNLPTKTLHIVGIIYIISGEPRPAAATNNSSLKVRQQLHKVRNVPLCLFLAAARAFRLEIWRFIAKSLPQANRSVSRSQYIWKKHGFPSLNWADFRQDRSSWRRLANWQIPRALIWKQDLRKLFGIYIYMWYVIQDSKQYLGQVSFEPLHVVFIQVCMPHPPI